MRIERNGISFQVTEGANDGFWRRLSAGEWEPETFRVLDRFITPATTVLDIGAWIGPITLYASRDARRVVAFEPDPVAFRELSANLAANPDLTNVELHQACVAVAGGSAWLGVDDRPGDSESSILFGDGGPGWSVPAVRLGDFIAAQGIERPLFIKMDIEGYEYRLIPEIMGEITTPGTVLYLSTHPRIFRDREAKRARSVVGRAIRKLVGRAYAIPENARLAKILDAQTFVYGEKGEPLRLRSRIPRLFFGRALTRTGALVVSADRLPVAPRLHGGVRDVQSIRRTFP